MDPMEKQAEQDQQELLKQIQAALEARKQREARPAPAFSPSEEQQFARFGLDPRRLRFLNTLSAFRRGLNLEQELVGRALRGAATPTSGGVMSEEELAPYA